MEVSSKVWRLDGCTKRVRCGGYEPPAARRHILGRKISHVATFAFAGGSGQRAAAWRRRHATIVAAMASGTSCGASRPRDSESSSSVICIERFDLFYLLPVQPVQSSAAAAASLRLRSSADSDSDDSACSRRPLHDGANQPLISSVGPLADAAPQATGRWWVAVARSRRDQARPSDGRRLSAPPATARRRKPGRAQRRRHDSQRSPAELGGDGGWCSAAPATPAGHGERRGVSARRLPMCVLQSPPAPAPWPDARVAAFCCSRGWPLLPSAAAVAAAAAATTAGDRVGAPRPNRLVPSIPYRRVLRYLRAR